MSQHKKCPQCGNEIVTEYFSQLRCPMCGWGMKGEPVIIQPPSKMGYAWSKKSPRWKTVAVMAVVTAVLVVMPLARMVTNQIAANHAIATAKIQMHKRLYASAARTLNQAPIKAIDGGTAKEMKTLTLSTIRWARDISDVKTAKQNIVAVQPEDALNNLDNIDSDFPQDDEAVDLMDLAQDQTLDPSIEVSDQVVDDIAYVPDDPELDNLDQLTTDAQDHLDIPDDTTTPADTTPDTPTSDGPTTDGPDGDPTSDLPPGEGDICDDGSAPDPDTLACPGDADPGELLPPEPEPDPSLSPANQQSKLAPFYQMQWQKKDQQQKLVDEDSLFTIDPSEVQGGKDAKTGFDNYRSPIAIGQLYTRKQKGNKNIVPLYRFWSQKRTDHFFTTQRNFSNNENANYVRQSAAGYIGKWDGKQCLAGTKPLWGIYNASITDNYYTIDPGFKDFLVSQGWVNPHVTGCLF